MPSFGSKWVIYMIALSVFVSSVYSKKGIIYAPVWDSLDTRPLPEWFFKAKIGIMIHWGLYSVPAFGVDHTGSEWFYFMWQNQKHIQYTEFITKSYGSNFTYRDFENYFTANKFNPSEWARLFKEAGARYVILTSKHHDGFTLWPSSHSTWNSVTVGPQRDLLGELATAVREEGLHFGVYYSLLDWQSSDYQSDLQSEFTTTTFVDNVVLPELKELVETYKPDIIWTDGEWEAPDTYWKSADFLAWLYNDSPVRDTVVVNDRWGVGTRNKHGDFMVDVGQDTVDIYSRHLEQRELLVKLDMDSYGYQINGGRSNFIDIKSIQRFLTTTVNRGVNMLLNIGPTKEGEIAAEFKDVLKELSSWLKDVGEAVYETVPKKFLEKDELNTMPMKNANIVYATFYDWPSKILPTMYTFGNASHITIELLGGNLEGQYDKTEDIYIISPLKIPISPPYIIKISNIC